MPSTLGQQEEVQQWLDENKFQNLVVDTSLWDTAFRMIVSRLMRGYTTSSWVKDDETTVPELVWKAVGMLTAAWTYDRAYSETTEEENKYSLKLESMAEDLISGIEEGTISMEDYAQCLPPGQTPGESPDEPDFFPNDASSSSPTYDSQGNTIGGVGSQDNVFSMGMKF